MMIVGSGLCGFGLAIMFPNFTIHYWGGVVIWVTGYINGENK